MEKRQRNWWRKQAETNKYGKKQSERENKSKRPSYSSGLYRPLGSQLPEAEDELPIPREGQ